MSVSLVGRAEQLRLLSTSFERARAADGPVAVALVGPEGSGKAALMRSLAAELPSGTRARWATGGGVESTVPFGIVEQLLGATAGELGTLADGPDASGSPDVLRTGRRLVGALEDLAAPGPVVLFITDLHTADDQSSEALAFALRRLHRQQILVVVSVTGDVSAVARLAAEQGHLVELEPLSSDDVGALAEHLGLRTPAPRVCRRIVELSGGWPLAVRRILVELRRSGVPDEPDALPIPPDLALSVLSALEHRSADARAMVEASCVIGRPVRASVVADVAGLVGPAAQLAAIEDAVAADLLALDDVEGVRHLRPAHPLVGATVRQSLTARRREELHVRAAQLVPEPLARLRHRLASLRVDDEVVVAAVDEAARQRAAGEFRVSASLLTAAGLVASESPARERCERGAADDWLAAGDVGRARALLAQVPLDDSALDSFLRAQVAFLDGDVRTALAGFRVATERAEGDGECELVVRAAGGAASVCVMLGRGADAVAWAERALKRATPAATDVGSVLNMLGMAHALGGRIADGIARLDALLPSFSSPVVRADGQLGRGVLRMWAGDFEAAERDLRDARELTADGPALVHLSAMYYLSDLDDRRGRLVAAVEQAGEVVRTARELGLPVVEAMAASVLAGPLAAVGRDAEASGHAASALARARHVRATSLLLWSVVALGRCAVARGDHEQVVTTLAPLARGLGEAPYCETIRPFRADLVAALVALGRVDDAAEVSARMAADARATGVPLAALHAARADALVATATGETVRAVHVLDDALTAPAAQVSPVLVARLAVDLARARLRLGHTSRARDALVCARRVLEPLGASVALAEIDRLTCEVGAASASEHSPTVLSARELAIARLVAQGLTNQEVAARTFVSAKTIEYHVSNVLRKLGARNRVELAARLAERPADT